jgi:AraC-like DNA-binding protein
MAILSRRLMGDVAREYQSIFGLKPAFLSLSGGVLHGSEPIGAGPAGRRKRHTALQESISTGEPCVFHPLPGVTSWILALEDHRLIHGAAVAGEILTDQGKGQRSGAVDYLVSHGWDGDAAKTVGNRLAVWPEVRVREAAVGLGDVFYRISGWKPLLMTENRLKIRQQKQISQSIDDLRRSGRPALYAFEKERMLLTHIRAGDRPAARQILNEMLATIFLSSPQQVVLRARAIELVSYLTRAAIEDNALLEPLIERNHAWTERLVRARSFEELSRIISSAMDDFMDAIDLHGMNRTNTKVRAALDYIGEHYGKKLSLRYLAAHVGLSPSRLSHLVRNVTGKSLTEVTQQVRIRHAQHLLERTDQSCTEIAYEVGYNDQSYFIKHFRRLTGTTPLKYRQHRP